MADKQTDIQTLREQTRLVAVQRIKEALDADEFDDVAKLAKDTLSVFAKEDQTAGAREGIHFAMVQAFAKDATEIRKYVHATQPEIKRLLPG